MTLGMTLLPGVHPCRATLVSLLRPTPYFPRYSIVTNHNLTRLKLELSPQGSCDKTGHVSQPIADYYPLCDWTPIPVQQAAVVCALRSFCEDS
jgi:hypothetical protein